MSYLDIKGELGSFSLDASMIIARGINGMFGPSGAGKTTILRAICGLWQPQSGVIEINGTVFFDSKKKINKPVQSRKIGAVFQNPLLFPHMTVMANLSYGMQKESLEKNAWDEIIAMLDLAPLLNRMPRNLSGGEAQRVALGRALLSQPEILLLDEPLTGLDDERRFQVFPYLEKMCAHTQIPIIYVSHNREEMQRLADCVFRVEKGRIIGEMSPAEFAAESQLV